MRDLLYAARGLARARAFTLTSLTTLALATGAAIAVFTIVDAVLLRPLPYRDPAQVVIVWATPPDGSRTWLSVPEVEDLSRDARSLAGIAGLADLRMNVTGAGAPEEVQVVAASASLFPLLGVEAALGRTFDADDDRIGAQPVVVLADAFWRRRFGADPNVAGRTLLLDGRSYVIRGVLPARFSIPAPSSVFPASVDAWVALTPHAPTRARDVRYLHALARLVPGVTATAAEAEAARLGAGYTRAFPQVYRAGAWTFAVRPLQEDVARGVRPVLTALGWIVAILMAIACVNVANLLLVRGEQRRRELAVRIALGASRGRLLHLLFSEAVLLGISGCGAGALVALGVPRLLTTIDPRVLPVVNGISFDVRVAWFVLLLVGLVVAICAAVPVLTASRAGDVASVDRSVGRSLRFALAGRTLAIAQIALAALALVCTALLARTVVRLTAVPSGIDPGGVLTFRVSLPGSYRTGADVTQFFDRAVERVQQLPGVQRVGAITQLPMSGASLGSTFERVDPGDTRRLDADLRGVAGDYFGALHIPLVAGRMFTASDLADHPSVAIVDRAFARRLRPDGNVLGLRLRWIRRPDDPIEIVGIVGDVRHRGPAEAARETVYRPAAQYARWAMTFVVRAERAADLASPAAAAIQSIDPGQPVADLALMTDIAGRSVARPRLAAALAFALGLMALVISVVGVYGVLSYSVSQRVREFAVRLAIGATPRKILALVFKEGAAVTIAGIAAGFAVAPSAATVLAAALFGVGATDLAAYASAGAALALAAAVACYIPAHRASRSDPMSVLRSE